MEYFIKYFSVLLYLILLSSCQKLHDNSNDTQTDFLKLSGFDDKYTVDNLFMLDSVTGWVAGSEYEWQERDGHEFPVKIKTVIFRTYDGWKSFEISEYPYFNTNDIYFINDSTGWITGLATGHLLETRDGGVTWAVRNIGANTRATSILFLDGRQGWITSENAMFYTANSGTDWEPVLYTGNLLYRKIRFLSSDTGFCLGSNDNYYAVLAKTVDACESWEIIHSFINPQISDFYTADGIRFIGVSAILMTSADSGYTWEVSQYGIDGNAIEFFNAQQGVILGGSETWLTDNGGVTWYNAVYNADARNQPKARDHSIASGRLFVLTEQSVWLYNFVE